MWAVIVIVLGGILLVGFILLVIVKIILYAQVRSGQEQPHLYLFSCMTSCNLVNNYMYTSCGDINCMHDVQQEMLYITLHAYTAVYHSAWYH